MIKYIKSLLFKPKVDVWFTSDLHFGHRNVIAYCNRPYADRDIMNEALVELWNKQVKPKDIVYVIGDFSLSPKVAGEFVKRLNGVKHLVCGNHDAPFEANKKADKMKARYIQDGWASVQMKKEMILSAGYNVLLSHLPYASKEGMEYDTRYANYRPLNKGTILLHGHLHCRYLKYNNMIDVGIDNNFTLYSENDIISIIKDQRQFIESRLTDYYKTLPKREGMDGEGI